MTSSCYPTQHFDVFNSAHSVKIKNLSGYNMAHFIIWYILYDMCFIMSYYEIRPKLYFNS